MRLRARPRYLQLAEELRADILGARLRAGDPLPTEAQLTERFGVSRFTVREALRQLAADGLIERRRGSGTVVAGAPALRQALTDTRALLQYAANSEFRIGAPNLVRLRPGLAHLLGRPAGESWWRVRGVRLIDGADQPIAMTDAFIHPRFSGVVPQLARGREALFAQLARLAGLSIGRVRQEIQAVAAGPDEAAALGIARGSPALRIVRHYFDQNDELAEMSCSVHPGRRFSYMVETRG